MVEKKKAIKTSPLSYVERSYRQQMGDKKLFNFVVQFQETDLHITCDRDAQSIAMEQVIRLRNQIENYIYLHPGFHTSLIPLSSDPSSPKIIQDMLHGGRLADVGPMAAVAGAMAEHVGRELVRIGCGEVVVENGGDVYVHRSCDVQIGIYAGESPLSNRVGVLLRGDQLPMGVCTSSGKIGHSLSFGVADSVTVIAENTAVADATATRLGNEIGKNKAGKREIEHVLQIARTFPEISGTIVICGELMGAVGDVKLIRLGE